MATVVVGFVVVLGFAVVCVLDVVFGLAVVDLVPEDAVINTNIRMINR